MTILLLNNYSHVIPLIDVFLVFIDKMIIFVVNNISILINEISKQHIRGAGFSAPARYQ